jgi:putative flippase GtrA
VIGVVFAGCCGSLTVMCDAVCCMLLSAAAHGAAMPAVACSVLCSFVLGHLWLF